MAKQVIFWGIKKANFCQKGLKSLGSYTRVFTVPEKYWILFWTLPGVVYIACSMLNLCLFLTLFSGDNIDSDDWDSDGDEQHDISIEKTTTQENISKNNKGKNENYDEDR